MAIDSGKDESPMMFFEKQVEWFLSIVTQNNFASKMFVFMGLVAINAKDNLQLPEKEWFLAILRNDNKE